MLTDSDGAEVRRLAYAAFGEELENTGPGDAPHHTYTGQEPDASGLLYYGARYYDPALARFITPDTMDDVGPQGLNRYSYALNNPIIYRDPTGHFVNGSDDDENPTCDGCVTGPSDEGGKAMVYHENSDDPSSPHHHSPFPAYHRWPHRIASYHSTIIMPVARRGTAMWADTSSPIPEWLAEHVGNYLGALSPGEKINPFTRELVPRSVIDAVVMEGVVVGVAGIAKFAGIPVTASGDDIAKIAQDLALKGEMNPLEINFSQRTVSANVSHYIDDMASGNWDWSRSGPLRIMKRDGQWVSYDNRRLMAAQKAGLESVPIEIVNPEILMPGSKKTWEQVFIRRFNDPRNINVGGPVPNQGLQTQPKVVYSKRR